MFFSKIKIKEITNKEPVSKVFGFDRGTPIDRYYIESFLKEQSHLIQGNVLEIAESTYTNQFGVGVSQSHILHYDNSNTKATIIGDLCDTTTLPENTIDCFICTQTFNFIYDYKKAIEGSYHVLKKEGVLLATLACMTPISKYDADRWGDYWRFMPQAVQKMFAEVFSEHQITLSLYGNSAVAALFMKGYSLEDIKKEVDLDYTDELFPLIIGVKAIK